MGTFGAYSKYYDLLYKDKDYAGEVAYISSLLEEHAPDGRSILELGCGTGRHAAMLAEKKWIVHGIDLSTDMLKAAQERKRSRPSSIGDRLRFSVGDVRDFDTGEQYDAVLSLFHVVSYQNANDDVLAMFRNAAAHLKPGGVFVFDYWYGPAVLTDRPAVRVKRMHSEEIDVTRLAEPIMHPNSSLVDVNYQIFIHELSSGKMDVLRENHRMRYFFLNEIELLLREAGLNHVRSGEWLTGRTPAWDTWGVCSIASK